MGNGVHDELIRKQDALDALMAERKRLLANGQKGAEHILTHHGYNVIDELPTVQSDVPVINVGDMISRQAAIDATSEIVFVEYEDDDQGKEESIILQTKAAIRDRIKALPLVQPETCEGCKHLGKWENEVEYGYPSPCTRCKRRAEDHYER